MVRSYSDFVRICLVIVGIVTFVGNKVKTLHKNFLYGIMNMLTQINLRKQVVDILYKNIFISINDTVRGSLSAGETTCCD